MAVMHRAASRYRALTRLTPRLDIVFFLAVFAILVASIPERRTIGPHGVDHATAHASMAGTLLIEILPDSLRMSGDTVSLEELGTRIAQHVAERPDHRLMVRPAPDVSMQRTIQVLGRLETSGLTRMSLIHPPVSDP